MYARRGATMRPFVALVIVNAVLTAHGGNQSDREITEMCMAEIGIDPEFYESAAKTDIHDVDERLKCLDACLLKAYNIMNDDGSVNKDEIMQFISDAEASKDEQDIKRDIVETCGAKKGTDQCDTAYKMMMCLNEALKKLSSEEK